MIMSNEKIIEIPYKWLKTLNRSFYFEMFRDMVAETGQTYKEVFYQMEQIRTDMHLPEMYTSFESFKRNYYKWLKEIRQSNNMLPDKSDKGPKLPETAKICSNSLETY